MVVVVVVVALLGQVDLTHPHGEEAEGGGGVQGVLCSAVMATVRVVAAEEQITLGLLYSISSVRFAST